MDEFDRYTDDDGGFIPDEMRERYNIFDKWYYQTTKRAFIVWWVILALVSVYYFFGVASMAYAKYGWNVISSLSFILLFVFPTFISAFLARIMVNWLHYKSLWWKCTRFFNNNENALKRLDEYRNRFI